MSRWVLVDDTDPDIQYLGQWFSDKGSQDNLGNFGKPYLSTLHGISDGNGSFSYSFRGSRVLITGTVTEFPTLPDGAVNESWECFVDGVALQSITYTVPENLLQTTFDFNFNGIQLTWWGFYDSKQATVAITASYSIDGQQSITFPLNGAVAISSGVQYSPIFFETGRLSPGDHKLNVVYLGDSSKTPLNLHVLIVQNGSALVAAPNITITTSSNPTPSQTSTSNNPDEHLATPKKVSKGVLIGAILGGLVFLVVIFGTLAYRRRRQQSRRPTSSSSDAITTATLNPFIIAPSSHLGTCIPLPAPPTADLPPHLHPTKPSKGHLGSTTPLPINTREGSGSSGISGLSSSAPFPSNSRLPNYEARSEARDEDGGLHAALDPNFLGTLPPRYTLEPA